MNSENLESLLNKLSIEGKERGIFLAVREGLLVDSGQYTEILTKVKKELTSIPNFINELSNFIRKIESSDIKEERIEEDEYLPSIKTHDNLTQINIGDKIITFEKREIKEAIAICLENKDYKNAGLLSLEEQDINKAINIYEQGKMYHNAATLCAYNNDFERAMINSEKCAQFKVAYMYAVRIMDLGKAELYWQLAQIFEKEKTYEQNLTKLIYEGKFGKA
jgi:hypothetical protein